jgi:hypothetical protein
MVNHKIYWGVGSAFNFGHIDGWDGYLERLQYPDKRFAFMVSTPKRTYLHVSESFSTREAMETGAISYLIKKGELL